VQYYEVGEGVGNGMELPVQSAKASRHVQVLLVDDDALVRKLCSLMLAQRGYDVRTAADGLDALERIKEFVPDLIISDLRMPRMSGFEFLSIMRRRFPEMPLIAISGEFLISGDPALGIADAFFPKGEYSPDRLIAKVDELLAHPPVRHPLDSPPIWVPVGPSGDVVLTCTNCLRSFSVRVCPPAFGNPLREIECVSCSTRLRYCIDATSLPVGERSWETCGGLTRLRNRNDSGE
jgi:CheY-like chemotaxis protein